MPVFMWSKYTKFIVCRLDFSLINKRYLGKVKQRRDEGRQILVERDEKLYSEFHYF